MGGGQPAPERGRFSPQLLEEIRARTRLSEIVGRHVALRRQGRELLGLCPFHGEKTPSFTVVDPRGFYHCFGCGAHGDAIAFMMQVERLSFAEAVAELGAACGLLPSASGERRSRPAPRIVRQDTAAEAAELARRMTWSRAVWRSARLAAGTLVETYLRSRGITVAPPPTLRFHPALKHPDGCALPAMVAAVQGSDGGLAGIHRTYLRPAGTGKADVGQPKLMVGRCWGGAIRLAPAGPVLALAEGIETALSVLQASPGLPVWAAGTLGNLAGAGRGRGRPHPDRPNIALPSPLPDMDRPGLVLPALVREVLIIADSDGDRPIGVALVERAARRFAAQGRKVRIAWPPRGRDANDELRAAE